MSGEDGAVAQQFMKLLVFAPRPPPHHGQSRMVDLLLRSFGDADGAAPAAKDSARLAADSRRDIECYHVDCRFAETLEDIGRPRGRKIGLLFKYCAAAIWRRLCYGVRNFYYVPAPGSRPDIYKDWLVMALCRPFFPNLIFHWHSAGLGPWLENSARPWERWISRWLLGRPALSILIGACNRPDSEAVVSKQVAVVHNGIPDPCPQYETEIRPRRIARAAARRKLLSSEMPSETEQTRGGDDARVFRVLSLAMCSREKGLFDALEAVSLAQRQLSGTTLSLHLTVAGAFRSREEQMDFPRAVERMEVNGPGCRVEYVGFAEGERKHQLFCASDCFCFPTWYGAENFPLVVLEAMAYGLMIVTTNWRAIPEILPPGYPGLVPVRSPDRIAEALLSHLRQDHNDVLRTRFLANFTEDSFVAKLRAALLGIE